MLEVVCFVIVVLLNATRVRALWNRVGRLDPNPGCTAVSKISHFVVFTVQNATQVRSFCIMALASEPGLHDLMYMSLIQCFTQTLDSGSESRGSMVRMPEPGLHDLCKARL